MGMNKIRPNGRWLKPSVCCWPFKDDKGSIEVLRVGYKNFK